MILYVDFEHHRFKETHPEVAAQVAQRRLDARAAFEALSGQACELIHYTAFRPDAIIGKRPQLVIISGHNTDHVHYSADDRARLDQWILQPACPTFCICGSFQSMARMHGAEIGPMGPTQHEAEHTPDAVYPPSMRNEVGYSSVQPTTGNSALFRGLSPHLTVRQHHYWEVKTVPQAFRATATSSACSIQALEHGSLPLVGCQFHPEDFTPDYPDGAAILRNLFARWILS